jgi:ribosomal protein S18 acetylase RimI-like enzyme
MIMDSKFKVVEYRPEFQFVFERLNKAWLKEYFTVEPLDKWVLENPQEAILDDKGCILFVEYQDVLIGTVALKFIEPGSYEMTKMAVDEKYQGIGAGIFICKAAIQRGEDLNAKNLILYSQNSLAPAINIYRKLGFKEIPLEKGKYERANIKMEIIYNY